MAQYKVLETSYIHDRLVKPGDIVEWEPKKHGTPGPNLEPVKKDRPVATAKVEADADPANTGTEGEL